jgi:hypothetical protein
VSQQISLDSGLGLSGMVWKIVNTSFAVIIGFSFLYLLQQIVTYGRQDRVEDRAMFLQSIRDLKSEADRHTGEIKGAMDANTAAMKEMIAEMQRARKEGRVVPAPDRMRPPT